jgi:hypothetical protein
MSRTLLGVLALVLIGLPGTIHAQSRWRFEIRGGPAFAIEDLGAASLGTGFGLEGTVAYRIQPHVSVYAGWDWHRFPSDASSVDPTSDFEETGYAVGFQFEHPIARSESLALQLRAGGTYSHIEMENTAGGLVADSGHGLGWEGGAALAVRLDNRWQVTPGLRFRSLTREWSMGSGATSANLRYLAIEAGVSRRF